MLTAIPARHLNEKAKTAADACGKSLEVIGIVPVAAKWWLPVADGIIASCYGLLWG